jgi:hypothetical protein
MRVQVLAKGEDAAIKAAVVEIGMLEGVLLADIEPRPRAAAADFLSTGKFNQIDAAEVVIAVVINFATSAGYDAIKSQVMRAFEKRGVDAEVPAEVGSKDQSGSTGDGGDR